MRNSALAAALCGVTLIIPASGASAAILPFTGTANATASVAPDPSCQPFAPLRGTILPANSSGTSNLGNFTYSHSVCTQGAITPTSLQDGTFAINFANGSINGTLTGSSTPSATPGIYEQLFTYLVTGGTGAFFGASGAFGNIGTVDTRTAPPSRLAFTFDGAINAPGIPEPATWLMLILGFGAIGGALRRSRPHGSLAFG